MALHVVYFVSNEYNLRIAIHSVKDENDAINWVESKKKYAEYLGGHLKIEQLEISLNKTHKPFVLTEGKKQGALCNLLKDKTIIPERPKSPPPKQRS